MTAIAILGAAWLFVSPGTASAVSPGVGLVDRDGPFLCAPDPLVLAGSPDGTGVCFDQFPDPEVQRPWTFHKATASPGGTVSPCEPNTERSHFFPGKDGAVRKESNLRGGP